MSKLTAKFVHAETQAESVVVGSLVEKFPDTASVTVSRDNESNVVFDLTKGSVFVMNEAGKTVATYRQIQSPSDPNSDQSLGSKPYTGSIA